MRSARLRTRLLARLGAEGAEAEGGGAHGSPLGSTSRRPASDGPPAVFSSGLNPRDLASASRDHPENQCRMSTQPDIPTVHPTEPGTTGAVRPCRPADAGYWGRQSHVHASPRKDIDELRPQDSGDLAGALDAYETAPAIMLACEGDEMVLASANEAAREPCSARPVRVRPTGARDGAGRGRPAHHGARWTTWSARSVATGQPVTRPAYRVRDAGTGPRDRSRCSGT